MTTRAPWLLATLLGGCDLIMLTAVDAPPQVDTVDAGPLAGQAVAAHNQIRAQASPAPQPALEAMHWDESAAAVAASWARMCIYEHSHTAGYGENIFASTSTTPTITDAVVAWAGEVTDYSYATNSCAPQKVCGHYTQLVWRESTGVGCAAQVCTTGSPFGTGRWLIWVCDYIPPGNYIGERPY